MIICSKCKKENVDEARFCCECGENLKTKPTTGTKKKLVITIVIACIILGIVAVLFATNNNSSKETFSYKIKSEYSSKISSKFALDFLDLSENLNKLVNNDTSTENSKEYLEAVQELKKKCSDEAKEDNNETEIEMAELADEIFNKVLDRNVESMNYEIAKVNNDAGMGDKKSFEELKSKYDKMNEELKEELKLIKKYID